MMSIPEKTLQGLAKKAVAYLHADGFNDARENASEWWDEFLVLFNRRDIPVRSQYALRVLIRVHSVRASLRAGNIEGVFWGMGKLMQSVDKSFFAQFLGDIQRGQKIKQSARDGGLAHGISSDRKLLEQTTAEIYWEKNPRLSKRDVANKIAAQHGGNADSIRQRIVKPRTQLKQARHISS